MSVTNQATTLAFGFVSEAGNPRPSDALAGLFKRIRTDLLTDPVEVSEALLVDIFDDYETDEELADVMVEARRLRDALTEWINAD